jgi:hypothetical protein
MRNMVMRTVNNKVVNPTVLNHIQPTDLASEFSRLMNLVREADGEPVQDTQYQPVQQELPDAEEQLPEEPATEQEPEAQDEVATAYNQAIDDAIERIREENPHEDDVKAYIAILQSLKKPFGVTDKEEEL